jgi:hypothetical protein
MHSYWSWISPQPHSLASGWSVSSRVASYLLPRLRGAGTKAPLSGIPGLRLDRCERGLIRLIHLPTSGTLAIYDQHPSSAIAMKKELAIEIENRGGRETVTELWQEPQLAPEELKALGEWTLAPHSALLSAIMSRAGILWQHWGNKAELTTVASAGTMRLSWWEGPSPQELIELFTRSPIRIQGARKVQLDYHELGLVLGDSLLELRGPTAASASAPD